MNKKNELFPFLLELLCFIYLVHWMVVINNLAEGGYLRGPTVVITILMFGTFQLWFMLMMMIFSGKVWRWAQKRKYQNERIQSSN